MLQNFHEIVYFILYSICLFRCECHDKPQKVCKTYTEHEADCNYVEENICTTKYKGVCKPENTTVMEPWEDKKCIDEEKEKCTKKWMTVGYARVCKIDLNVYRN